ncbi:TIGR03086 family metal-binding protein [Wenjunlia tyrosinilytica]|uniref:TIGR03086 family protein n=1 Tax=Wenjunlia tyrosinilytica TaxID=1544741 RepID=A0A918DWH0_9ACTN|nr:TIGR03086 family metal-binding protein [Wenjunlia tyrosinilytica]GGO84849.1 TIGR03086 family protein [Wenjunlia tyrosinilytica]
MTDVTGSGTPMIDLEPAARRIALLAEGVTNDQLTAPTPCPGCAVRNMLGHLIGLSVAFRDAGRKELGETTGTPPNAVVPDIEDGESWRTELPQRLDELTATWRDPEAWEGMTQAGGLTFPAAEAGRVALNELLIHGWDLARATGQPYDPDTLSLEASYAMLAPTANERPPGGPFGPAVEIPADAPLLDRVIGLSGRDPSWKP